MEGGVRIQIEAGADIQWQLQWQRIEIVVETQLAHKTEVNTGIIAPWLRHILKVKFITYS